MTINMEPMKYSVLKHKLINSIKYHIFYKINIEYFPCSHYGCSKHLYNYLIKSTI